MTVAQRPHRLVLVQLVDRHRYDLVTRYRQKVLAAARRHRERTGGPTALLFRCEAVTRLSWARPCGVCEAIAAARIENGSAFGWAA